LSSDGALIPHVATLREVTDLTADVKLFNVEIEDSQVRESLDYKPGQFGFVSAFGIGESPFGITSSVHRKNGLEFAIRKVGTVTAALHELESGAQIGVRLPCGNYFPMEDYKGNDVYIIGGGIGMAPLRPVIHTLLDNRSDYGKVVVLNGARTPGDLVFATEFEEWAASPNTTVELTVDRGDDSWQGRVALIPAVVAELSFSPKNSVTIICGPPIMIKFTLVELKKLGFEDDQIVTTLEAKMKCGLGKCARCNVGDKYVCKNGPVFTFAQISEFIEQY